MLQIPEDLTKTALTEQLERQLKLTKSQYRIEFDDEGMRMGQEVHIESDKYVLKSAWMSDRASL
jgi:hypothetical protein